MKPGPRPTVLDSFVDDLQAIRYAGYVTRDEYAKRLNITLVCFDRRMARAREQGLLPSSKKGAQRFYPFGPPRWGR